MEGNNFVLTIRTMTTKKKQLLEDSDRHESLRQWIVILSIVANVFGLDCVQ